MDEYERFIFDTQGCIILRDVLSSSEIDRLKKGLPHDNKGEIVRPVRLGNCLLVNKLLSCALFCAISIFLEK